MLLYLLSITSAFLIGAIPSGFLVGLFHGIDIREHGSKNIGATNAKRVLGKRAGIFTLISDILKGIVVSYLGILLEKYYYLPSFSLAPFLGACAVYGHCFSPFLGFKGGKGVATSFGAFIVLAPKEALLLVLVFVLVVSISKYVSLGSIIGATVMPILVYFFNKSLDQLFISCLLISILVIARHYSNIKRLISGNENKII